MTTVNWDLFKCRCSGIHKITSNKRGFEPLTELQEKRVIELEEKNNVKPITDKQREELTGLYAKREASKGINLSDMCIEYLMEVFAWETEGMIPVSKESMDILSISKGRKQEAQAGALMNFVDDVIYKTHKERISNDFLTGEIDFYLGESVYKATRVNDVKNAWDYPGFLKKINNGLENGQKEQIQGYGCITGAPELNIVNCLVDCTEQNIEEVKWRVAKKFDAISIESPEFLVEWAKWEKSMIFNHIDPYKRVHKIAVEPFTPFEQQKVYDRVKQCREFLWKFDESFSKMNKS
jgi:hypothetical protein